MEPPKKKINLAYTILTTCISVEERFIQVYSSGVGKEAVFEQASTGWWATFEGSYEALYFGEEKPWFDKGDKMKVMFQRSE